MCLFSVVSLQSRPGLWGPSCPKEDWYTGEVWVCVSHMTNDWSLWKCLPMFYILLYCIHTFIVCLWTTGIQTKLRKTGADVDTVEMTPAEQSKEGLNSTSQKPPPSPAIDWSQSEIEDDDRCVTVVIPLLLQVSLLMEESSIVVTTVLQECWTVLHLQTRLSLHTNYNLIYLA